MNASAKNIAIIGVGYMGHGIAYNILKNGFTLKFLDHPGNQPTDDLVSIGGSAESDVKALGLWADVVILCVTGSPQVEDVLYQQGLLEALGPGKTVIDCSTAIPSSTLRIVKDVQAKGANFMDAPMTRTPKEAAEGRLNLIVGAPTELFEQVKPLLESFAENITHAGDIGAGHQMKLIHNFVSLGFAGIFSEAAASAKVAGIKPEVFLDILGKGGGAGVVFNRLQPYLESGDVSGFQFSLSNARKDLTYYDTMATESGAKHDLASAMRKFYEDGAKQDEAAPMPKVIDMLVKAAGK
ncbi:MAG: NAD(P)-dependent oxidoreductase [Burkholderiaceae bacterium]|nr:NAD(P)-dependent oxidoreductase [Burkholderiaceae bacterium]MCD8517042.1 NAD(P)-dependent oxidoreductase [Burkholderiaceae bacterium]MCD8536911.1 NAD(P)-dependent oxidoreductase [Burkholderiaceae bacterium]MCD8566063.1 NAD(P)-dependent oxidoreductase [Burkholderiaceae bacterium]